MNNMDKYFGKYKKIIEIPRLRAEWNSIVGTFIGNRTIAGKIENKKLTIYTNDNNIIPQINIHKGNIINKINEYFEEEIVNDLSIYMDKMNNIKNNIYHNMEDGVSTTFKEKNKYNINIDMEEKEREEILSKIIDERRTFLIEKGYIKCNICGELFYPESDDSICVICESEKERRIINKVKEKLIDNYKYNGKKDDIGRRIMKIARDELADDEFIKMQNMISDNSEAIINNEITDDFIKQFNKLIYLHTIYSFGNESSLEINKGLLIRELERYIKMRYGEKICLAI